MLQFTDTFYKLEDVSMVHACGIPTTHVQYDVNMVHACGVPTTHVQYDVNVVHAYGVHHPLCTL